MAQGHTVTSRRQTLSHLQLHLPATRGILPKGGKAITKEEEDNSYTTYANLPQTTENEAVYMIHTVK